MTPTISGFSFRLVVATLGQHRLDNHQIDVRTERGDIDGEFILAFSTYLM